MHMESTGPEQKQVEAANALICKYAIYGMGCGLIPSPGIDMIAVTVLEVQMIRDLSAVYTFNFPHKLVTSKIVLSLLGSIAPIYFARRFQNSVKLIPGFGYWLSAGLLAAANGASVYAIGKIFQRHFESRGTFLSTDTAMIRRFFRQSYEEGKVVLLSAEGQAERGGGNL